MASLLPEINDSHILFLAIHKLGVVVEKPLCIRHEQCSSETIHCERPPPVAPPQESSLPTTVFLTDCIVDGAASHVWGGGGGDDEADNFQLGRRGGKGREGWRRLQGATSGWLILQRPRWGLDTVSRVHNTAAPPLYGKKDLKESEI